MRDFARPRLWLGLGGMMLFLTLVVCLLPMPELSPGVSHFDKLEHAFGYAVLSAYAATLFARGRALLLAALGLVAYGVLIEALQALLPWRSLDPLDAVFNTVGVSSGALLWFTPAAGALQWIERRWRRSARDISGAR